MDVFTNLLGTIPPIINYSQLSSKRATPASDSKTLISSSPSSSSLPQVSGDVPNTDYSNFLRNLNTDEINAIVKKYVNFNDETGETESMQNMVQNFMVLLTVPCVAMFFILITQHVALWMKLLIGFLTIMHIIVITMYLHEHTPLPQFNSKTQSAEKSLPNHSNIKSTQAITL